MTWSIGADVVAGRVIAQIRRDLGLPPAALASGAGIHPRDLSKLETGTLMPTAGHLVAIEQALRAEGLQGPPGVLLARVQAAEQILVRSGASVTRRRTAKALLGAPLREFVDTQLLRASSPVVAAGWHVEEGFSARRPEETVPELLRRLRLRSGRSQATLSVQTGVGRSMLSMLETGERSPTLQQLVALEKTYMALGILQESGELLRQVAERL